MPSGRNSSYRKKPLTRSKRRKVRHKKQRRGPVMRFRFSRLILIWILSLIICFGAYLLARNLNPDKDVFVKPAPGAETANSVQEDEVSAEQPEPTTEIQESEVPADETSGDEGTEEGTEEGDGEESAADQPTTNKINPVPESEAKPQDYLAKCAFVGETNIYNLGEDSLLNPYSVYASETLTLENYAREYVLLNGTTIRILSALNQASCPIYLMFGTESLTTQGADQTVAHFAMLLGSLKATAPEATIYIMSIPPVTAEAEKLTEGGIKNSVIDEYNSLLLETANKNDVYFIDVNTALKNNEGKLDGHLATEDGMHLSLEGSMILLNYVLTHVPAEQQ